MFAVSNFYASYDKNIVYKKVPSKWIFEYYLNIDLDFNNGSCKMKSIFNKNDSFPSMFVYYDFSDEIYKFKCFSTSTGGLGIELVMRLFNVSYKEAVDKIIQDYDAFKNCDFKYSNGKSFKDDSELLVEKWVVSSYNVRTWRKDDANYWLQYGIGSKTLNKFNVKPLESFTLTKTLNEKLTEETFKVLTTRIYGYFNDNDELCKIYTPENKKKKFIKVNNYVQGTEQLESHEILVIMSSLKDIMTIKQLGFKIDCIAPHSENSYFSKDYIDNLKTLYKYVLVCFDSDERGIEAMKYYRENFGLRLIYLPIEKDVSDIRKNYGKKRLIEEFYIKLQNCIENTNFNFA